MALSEGLGDLPKFDFNHMPQKDMVSQEEREEDDYQYITKMYPGVAREILEYAEDACDKLEYQGSMMFDEYMDRQGYLNLANDIYEKIKYRETQEGNKKDRLLYQMILILLGGEICHRRCRYRRKRRMFS